mgnify:CR=1 FL=1
MVKSNMFEEATDQREKEQTQLTAVVTGNAPEKSERTMKMTFSISPQDRILVKTYAIRRNLTVSDLFHKWIIEFCSE